MGRSMVNPKCLVQESRVQEDKSIPQDGQDVQENIEVVELVFDPDSSPSDEAEDPAGDYLAKLQSQPQPLSMETLKAVQDKLESWELMDEDLRGCFETALKEFSQEPLCVQRNTRMVIKHKNKELVFESGQKKCRITVSEGSTVELESWAPYWECLSHSAEPLSMEMLERVRSKARSCKAPEEVRNNLNVVVRDFSAELSCLRKNARLVIECDEGELVFVSGKGENKVDVCIIDGKISYRVVTTTWWVAFCRACWKAFNYLSQVFQTFMCKVADKVANKITEEFLDELFKKLGSILKSLLLL